jgi:hypothetical protein
MQANVETERKCATCTNWQPGKTNAEARAVWLVNCRLRPRWVFMPANRVCERWEPASEKAVQARLKWLG